MNTDTGINEEALEELSNILTSSSISSKRKEKNDFSQKSSESRAKINKALEMMGVLPPTPSNSDETQLWKRTVPSSLFSIPSILPLQTLAPLSSLSQENREKYRKNDTSLSDSDIIVEVPTSMLLPTSSSENNEKNSDLSARPLAGNLSGKLTEYTRGQVGRRQPFKAGGMDLDDEQGDVSDEKSIDSKEKERAEMARKALDLGGLNAWKENLLITAPPGVSFKGLGVQDVYTDEFLQENDFNNVLSTTKEDFLNDETKEIEDETEMVGNSVQFSTNTLGGNNNDGMWDPAYFDDDSLFGSDEEESESEYGESDNEEESHTNNESKNEMIAEESKSDSKEDENDEDVTEKESEDENIDSLLDELNTESTDSLFPKKNKSISLNPLLRSKQSSDRKSWAVTSSLPIHDFHAVVPNPALSFPFELDDFQKQAVARLERSECVFLAAHTSAGKTVCAEYAIALARKHCTRAIYTSPIKALSNQKYRDFKLKFGEDVGLITGDLQVNPDSSCLIMTTEILRSMLYRGADLVRDIEWVIFDEVHYINDTERGVVWEEVIIMLPDYVNLIFLSATTPNTIEFSDWIGRTKRKPIHVIRTNYRPVPLSHYLFAGNKLHKILEGQSGFLEKGHKDATKALLPTKATDPKKKEKGQPKKVSHGSRTNAWQQPGNKQNWVSLVKFLEREGLTPTVVFIFSKKKCEEVANMLRSLDLNTNAEKNAAYSFGLQTMSRLSKNDASLPQVQNTVEMVKRGIGVHHGGLLPILKEMIEILFARGLVKVLLATETFAMGVNMPARAVVFNSIRKHDGTQFRELEPGEYTQMAGRAGRRGLDKVGTVIMSCFGEIPPPQMILKTMLCGSSTKLSSQFRLTYNMILNLLRVEDMSVEGMIKRSFSEFATQRALAQNEYPKLLSRGTKTLARLDAQFEQEKNLNVGAQDIEEYYKMCDQLMRLNKELLIYILSSSSGGTAGGALIPGRIIFVTAARKKGYVKAPAIILQSPSTTKGNNQNSGDEITSKSCICMVLLPENYEDKKEGSDNTPKQPTQLNYVGMAKNRYYAIHDIDLDQILFLSGEKYKFDTGALYKEEEKKSKGLVKNEFSAFKSVSARKNYDDPFSGMVARGEKSSEKNKGAKLSSAMVEETVIGYLLDAQQQEMQSSLSTLDLRECVKGVHQGTSTFEFLNSCDEMLSLTQQIRLFESHFHPNIESYYASVERKEILRKSVVGLKHLLSNESLRLFPDFLQRKSLLQTMGYVDPKNDTVCVKGRVACEVNSCEELIVTEMVVEGMLNDLEPAEIVAALSALIFQEKSEDDLDSELPERLVLCCAQMKRIALNLGQMQNEHGLKGVDPIEYAENSLKFGLVRVVYDWANGVPFSNICELTLVQEGSIVRCITRLDELCREVRNCARVVGNPTLYRRMEAASIAIKRDIVFASSLYVS